MHSVVTSSEIACHFCILFLQVIRSLTIVLYITIYNYCIVIVYNIVDIDQFCFTRPKV